MAVLALVVVVACEPAVRGPRTGSTVAGSSPAERPAYLPRGGSWAPPVHREGGRVVMPVTFPDGTAAELVYPAALRLHELNVSPHTYADGGPRACGHAVSGTRHDPRAAHVRGHAPLAEHLRPDGETVALWDGRPWAEPHDLLVYRFGSWSVLIPCRGPLRGRDLAIWAENVHGRESADGLLVLTGTGPIVLHPWRDQNGPTLRLSSAHAVIDVRPLSELCAAALRAWRDTDPADGVVQWCPRGGGSIHVYANGFTRDGKDLLEDLVEGLEVRTVRAAT